LPVNEKTTLAGGFFEG